MARSVFSNPAFIGGALIVTVGVIVLWCTGRGAEDPPAPDAIPDRFARLIFDEEGWDGTYGTVGELEVEGSTQPISGSTTETHAPVPEQSALPRFELPPPFYSALEVLERDQVVPDLEAPSLGDADRHLKRALGEAGYGDLAYFVVDEGFALVTRLEKTTRDAEPAPESDRFMDPGEQHSFARLVEFLSTGFGLRSGRYRLFAFVVTNHEVRRSKQRISRDEATQWSAEGLASLPWSLKDLPYTANHQCTVLVYEFEAGDDGSVEVLDPSPHVGRAHLERAGILGYLGRP